MNIRKTFMVCSAFVAGLSLSAVAQDAMPDPMGGTPAAEPVFTPEPAPAPMPAPAPAPAPVSKPKPLPEKNSKEADFDQLRGRAYSHPSIINAAQAFTVDDILYIPGEFGGKTFGYWEPANNFGVASVKSGASTYFLGVEAAATDQLVLGMAKNDNSMGVALVLASDKQISTVKPATAGAPETQTRTTQAGFMAGVRASKSFGNKVAYGAVEYTRPVQEIDNMGGDPEVNRKYYDLDVNVNIYPTEGDLLWFAGVQVVRHNLNADSTNGNATTVVTDTNSRTEMAVNYDLGKVMAKTKRSRLILGSNNSLDFVLWDAIKAQRESYFETGLNLTPNILGEYAFTEKWLGFGMVGHTVRADFNHITNEGGSPAAEQKLSETSTVGTEIPLGTNAKLGVRYQNDWLAAEAAIEDQVFMNGTSSLFNGTNLVSTFGVMLKF